LKLEEQSVAARERIIKEAALVDAVLHDAAVQSELAAVPSEDLANARNRLRSVGDLAPLTLRAISGPTCTYDAFLTHDWGEDELGRDNHVRVGRVHERLNAAGLAPWFDEERMRGDINKTMSDALSNSACVVCFITERYITKASGNGPNGANDNCKFEFDTTLLNSSLGVDRMIAVVMEPRCRDPRSWPNGTVKGKLAPKLYVDLADDGVAFDEGVQRLITEVRQMMQMPKVVSEEHVDSSSSEPDFDDAPLPGSSQSTEPELTATPATALSVNADASPRDEGMSAHAEGAEVSVVQPRSPSVPPLTLLSTRPDPDVVVRI
jgi:hypothetical protein